jgi:hypothetical protein
MRHQSLRPILSLALAPIFFSVIDACCDLDDPIFYFRQCSNTSVEADRPFLVKAINYTLYDGGSLGPVYDPSTNTLNAMRIMLARNTLRPDCTGDWCELSGPVCKLIDCLPLNQDPRTATNDGATIITNFAVQIPADAGPDGAYYDLAAGLYNLDSPSSSDGPGLQYDNNYYGFNLTNSAPQNGTNEAGFYDFEVHPIEESYDSSWPYGLDIVPCAAYGCARSCVNQHYPKPKGDYDVFGDPRFTKDDFKAVKDCIAACPGADAVTNFCPSQGGEAQELSSTSLGLSEGLDTHIPDGCVRYEGETWPEASASLSASIASASSASWASYSATAYPTATPTTTSSTASASVGSIGKLALAAWMTIYIYSGLL